MDRYLTGIKLKRYYGFTEFLKKTSFIESAIKVDGRCALKDVFFLKISGRPSNSDYLLILSLFNVFIKRGLKDTLLGFYIPGAKKPGNSIARLFEIFGCIDLVDFRLANFIYMLLVVYIPRIIGNMDRLSAFSSLAIFPDFGAYPEKLDEYTKEYPQYSALLKKTGFIRPLENKGLLLLVPLSSYMLKHLYVSSIFEMDWSVRLEFYCLFDRAGLMRVPLFYSFLKFYMALK